MTATPDTINDVLHAIQERHPEWPQTQHVETPDQTAPNEPWTLVWDAAVWIKHWFEHQAHDDLVEAIVYFPLNDRDYGYEVARWHRNTKSPEGYLKSHLIRLTRGWRHEDALWHYLNYKSDLVRALGFDNLPSRSSFWKAWKIRLEPPARISLRIIANTLIQTAWQHDIKIPEKAFRPGFDPRRIANPGSDIPTEREFAKGNAEDIWRKAKPYVNRSYSLDRASNAYIEEESFWEAHTHVASDSDTGVETGVDNYDTWTDREHVQCGRYHRDVVSDIPIEKLRRSHRETARAAIEEAQKQGEFPDKVLLTPDKTKSDPLYTLDTIEGWDRDNPGEVTDKWILGYDDSDKHVDEKDINYYFQWAGIRTVGDAPEALLDAIPVHRGLPVYEIVDELLKYTKDIVDIDAVVADREFCNDHVKAVCLKHDVPVITPLRKTDIIKADCTRFRKQRRKVAVKQRDVDVSEGFIDEILDDETVDLTKQEFKDRLSCYDIFLPANSPEIWEERIAEIDEDIDRAKDPIHPQEIREPPQDLFEKDEDRRMFDGVVDEAQRKDEQQHSEEYGDSWDDDQLYTIFGTTLEDIPDRTDIEDENELYRRLRRIIEPYDDRWDIEQHWRWDNTFVVENVLSRDYRYRFFNFLFGMTLQNLWKLIDLLLKTAYPGELSGGSTITRSLFMTIVKKHAARRSSD